MPCVESLARIPPLIRLGDLGAGVGVHLWSTSQPGCSGNLLQALLYRLGQKCAYLPLATGESDVDETTGVLEALEGTALRNLWLLLGLNLHREKKIVSHIERFGEKNKG